MNRYGAAQRFPRPIKPDQEARIIALRHALSHTYGVRYTMPPLELMTELQASQWVGQLTRRLERAKWEVTTNCGRSKLDANKEYGETVDTAQLSLF